MDQFARETIAVSLEAEMRSSYLDYAMSVIVGRALPDVRDGLKPVHRRVLFAMHELNNDWNRPYKKSARIVGDVIGKYHPHGDTAVYDTIVRMAQNFSLRYMLVDGQGNFGSVDGDNAAAMRYTEIRLAKISQSMLSDIDQETVDFALNYDASEKEPLVLPARIPNLLINGSSGIAVGMATNIPPHNINEVINACLHLLHNQDCDIEELMEFIQAPDFPTGAYIHGIAGVRAGYRTGRGRVVMRAKTHFEDLDKGSRQAIIVDELPYQVNKKTLLERIAELVNEKRVEGISDIRDESDKSGMRVVIELKRGENPDIVLNNLYKYTQLQDSFGMNMVALLDGQPQLLNLRQFLSSFLAHRREVITRRTNYALRRAKERGHILEGLAVALVNIDQFIVIIKTATTPVLARSNLASRNWQAKLVKEMLVKKFIDHHHFSHSEMMLLNASLKQGLQKDDSYILSDIQTHEILQMRLQRLTGLEQEKILTEYKVVIEEIVDLLDILAKPARITEIIAQELKAIASEFGDTRRSEIVLNATELGTEDFITPQEMVITVSHTGYMKSQPITEYRAQKRGGRGKLAATTKEDDWIDTLFVANTHDTILCFSNRGRLYWLKVYEAPQGGRGARGKPVVNMFPLLPEEKINVILPVKNFDANHYVFMATSLGTVKKTALTDFSHPRKTGVIAVHLDEEDFLIGAAITDAKHDVMLFSDAGKAVRFDENDVRPTGRNSRGVRGMKLDKGQQVIAMLVTPSAVLSEFTSDNDNPTDEIIATEPIYSVLTATENGYGKRTALAEYTRHGRATKGMIAIKTSARNGKVVAATMVTTDHEIMLITTAGVLIRTRVSEIREMGRAAQGVTLINVESGTKLCGLQRILEADIDANNANIVNDEM